MKKIAILATAAIGMLASCTTNDFVGDENLREANEQGNGAIVFGTGVKAPTRADKEGAAAATALNNNFVVEGFKWNGGTGDTKETVFDHYNVNWATNTANTTTSNTNNWEYVGQTPHTYGPTAQSIKYWDYAKSQYDFIAYSAVNGNYTSSAVADQVTISEINPEKLKGNDSDSDGKIDEGAYTIEGKAADLAKVYIADMKTAYRDATSPATSDYQQPVKFSFRSLAARVRIALYETVPGYSVKDVVFYTDDSNAATDSKAHLYTTGTDVFNSEGKYIVYFPTTGSDNQTNPDYNKAHLAFEAPTTGGTTTTKTFGGLDLTNKGADKEVAEAAGKVYLGRASNAATFAGENTTENPNNYYTVVIPNENGAVLNLKVNYTLVSTDGSGETINVTGAKAQVPAEYASWKSGYAYTYLFKISQNSNGVTNPSAGPAGLYPITFDAVVTETEDGVQETITTVAEPSITTYANGVVVTANDEYTVGTAIYITAFDGTTTYSDIEMYKAELTSSPHTTINEAMAKLAYDQGKSDPNSDVYDKTELTLTRLYGSTPVTSVPAVDGNTYNVNALKFTPSAAGTYVARYAGTGGVAYKIIKVL